jgi:signal-transduction protein with cAMP-binding, CBS, and nucleotidyltransferase domain
MNVSSFMISPPVTVAPQTSVKQVAQRLEESSVGCVLVTDDAELLGIVTDRDLVVRAMARGLAADTPVSELMSAPVITVDANDDVGTAYVAFRRTGTRRLPVLDGKGPVGILSVDDLFLDVLERFADLLGPVCSSVLREPRHEQQQPSVP